MTDDKNLRERAALAALTGLLAGGKLSAWGSKVVADAAVRQADALIAELKEASNGTE